LSTSIAEQEHPIEERPPYSTRAPRERALLVAVDYRVDDWGAAASLEELARLSETAGLDVVGAVTQKLDHPHPNTYVGKGKLEEVADLREQLAADVVIFDDELSPAQLRNVEARLETKVIDRTALILDIFAKRAVTHEGRLQVELAQLEYRLPRLTRMWTHLERQGVGGVGLRGPGETQLETDRRLARARIALIKTQLSEVHRHRELYRARRRRNNVPVVAIVGYTNAGKSTLLNRLTAAGVLSEDQLFATLDPTTRRITLPGGRPVLLTDTVGFINHLPTTLVAAFRATLEEIEEATVLLHVLDISHDNAQEQAETVRELLEELNVAGKPMVTALNKVDKLGATTDPATVADELHLPTDYVPISAERGLGIDALLERIEAAVGEADGLARIAVRIPYERSELVNLFHRSGQVEHETFEADGAHLSGLVPRRLRPRFEPFVNGAQAAAAPVAARTNAD
jgi:GTP-binding protein HflX